MKLSTSDFSLTKSNDIHIDGSENWLQLIYDEFKSTTSQHPPKVTGLLNWRQVSFQDYKITGEVTCSLHITCTRCNTKLFHTFHEKILSHFTTRNTPDSQGEHESIEFNKNTPEPLENSEVDLSQFLFDTILLNIPAQTHLIKEHKCLAEAAENKDGDTLLHSTPSKNSPFAVLEKLKHTPNH
ncbi:MAG: DUF177 domain-containing protein [Oligoflexales bacterium]